MHLIYGSDIYERRTGIWAVCEPVAYGGTNKTVTVALTYCKCTLLVHLQPSHFLYLTYFYQA